MFEDKENKAGPMTSDDVDNYIVLAEISAFRTLNKWFRVYINGDNPHDVQLTRVIEESDYNGDLFNRDISAFVLSHPCDLERIAGMLTYAAFRNRPIIHRAKKTWDETSIGMIHLIDGKPLIIIDETLEEYSRSEGDYWAFGSEWIVSYAKPTITELYERNCPECAGKRYLTCAFPEKIEDFRECETCQGTGKQEIKEPPIKK